MTKLPKYVYRNNLNDKIITYANEYNEADLAKAMRDADTHFSVWELRTIGKSKSCWYELRDKCKDNTDMKDSWKCNCIKCQLKEVQNVL